ncbi:MAG: response regulator transcription factor [Solirubrobacterales bacterium]|nr:response regulator transcription factor [Solirubrobacterales bacterium]MBV9472806.1 response regulator transcription factor [Solirubrobacterales bacterium]
MSDLEPPGHDQRGGRERVSVVLADDHKLFRASLARAIVDHPELELLAQASNGIEALAAIEALEPDVALVDVRMPGVDGLGVCDRVSRRRPPLRTRVLLVTAFADEVSGIDTTALGAAGLLGKDASRAQLCAELIEAGRVGRRG